MLLSSLLTASCILSVRALPRHLLSSLLPTNSSGPSMCIAAGADFHCPAHCKENTMRLCKQTLELQQDSGQRTAACKRQDTHLPYDLLSPPQVSQLQRSPAMHHNPKTPGQTSAISSTPQECAVHFVKGTIMSKCNLTQEQAYGRSAQETSSRTMAAQWINDVSLSHPWGVALQCSGQDTRKCERAALQSEVSMQPAAKMGA